MGTPMDRAAEERFIWIGFAGFMVMLSGAVTIVQGLWALDHEHSTATAEVARRLSYANLETWGWILLIWGVLQFFAGFAVFARRPWGRWVGIAAATFSVLLMFFWISAFPIPALGILVIDIFVIYALLAHGGSDEPLA
jgi:hypothetical protein